MAATSTTSNRGVRGSRAVKQWVHRRARPPRVHVSVKTAPGLAETTVTEDLRGAGWVVHAEPVKSWGRINAVIVHGVGRPMTGDEQEIVTAVRADLEFLLADVDARVLDIAVREPKVEDDSEWVVGSIDSTVAAEQPALIELSNGLHLFGDRTQATERAEAILSRAGVRNGWSLKKVDPPLTKITAPPGRKTLILVAVPVAIGVIAGTRFPHWFGYDHGPLPSNAVATVSSVVALVALGLTAALLSMGMPSRWRARVGLTAVLVMIALAAGLGSAITTSSTSWWLTLVVVVVIVVTATLQLVFGPLVMGWVRTSRWRVPFGVILSAIGITLLVAGFHTPMAMYYLGAGVPELIGTESWGVAVVIGLAFVLTAALALVAASLAIAGWRRRASLLVPRVIIATICAALLTLVAALVLSASYGNGVLLARGDYTEGAPVGLYSVCVQSPVSPDQNGEWWLVGTDGRTSVLYDRSRDVARDDGRDPAPVRTPIHVDSEQLLQYVAFNTDCGG